MPPRDNVRYQTEPITGASALPSTSDIPAMAVPWMVAIPPSAGYRFRMNEPADIFTPEDDDALTRAVAEARDEVAAEQALRHGEAELDAGRFIPLADVVRWLDSWGTPDELPPPPWR